MPVPSLSKPFHIGSRRYSGDAVAAVSVYPNGSTLSIGESGAMLSFAAFSVCFSRDVVAGAESSSSPRRADKSASTLISGSCWVSLGVTGMTGVTSPDSGGCSWHLCAFAKCDWGARFAERSPLSVVA